MKNKIFRKTMSLVLALAVILSAMSCLMFVSVSAAQDYANLSKTFDFENATDVNAFIQVGGKTGNETAEGYTTWNYDPEVANVTGLNKKTIAQAEVTADYAAAIDVVSSNALLAKPYLNNSETSYAKANTAASADATTYVPHMGNTSMYVLKDSVDENGVAFDSITKDKISGKFSLDYFELDASTSQNYKALRSMPIIIYYYKDANNWRGLRFLPFYWNVSSVFMPITWQHIVCEDGYTFQNTVGRLGSLDTSKSYSNARTDIDLVNQRTFNGDYATQDSAVWNSKGLYGYSPVLHGPKNANLPANMRYGEWMNFSVEYLENAVAIDFSDATGYKTQYFIAEESTYTLYDSTGDSKQSSVIDLSTGSFALGVSHSIGTNSYRGTDNSTDQPRGIAFDDIKVEMSDSSETSVASVISSIDAIADEATYNTAKAAFDSLTDSQKLRVKNSSDLKRWENYFVKKRITYDFSEEWHGDALTHGLTYKLYNYTAAGNSDTYTYQNEIIKDSSNPENNVLRVNHGSYQTLWNRGYIYLDMPDALAADVEEITINVKNGLQVGKGDTMATNTGNSGPAFVKLDANNKPIFDGNSTSGTSRGSLLRFYRNATLKYGLTSSSVGGYGSAIAADIAFEGNDFAFKMVPQSATSFKLSFVGNVLADSDSDGTFETVTADVAETSAYTVNVAVNKFGITLSEHISMEIDSIDIKFKGWDSIVNLTAEEEALAARIEDIPEITINNYKDVNTEVLAIRAAVDALATTGLADKKPDGSELSYLELLAAAEAEIATFTGDVATAQAFANTNNAILNTIAANVDTTNAQTIIDVHTAYEALTDAVKSVLVNNYALLDNAATGEKFGFDVIANLKEIYALAIPLCPTAAQIAFLEHYEQNGIGELTAIGDKMATLEESIVLYKAVEETHKPNVQAKYDYIFTLLDKHFVDGNEFTYNAAEVKPYENIYAYFTGTVFTESTAGIDENRTKNNKVINSDKFDATAATSVKLVQDYAIPDGPTYFIKGVGFDLFPKVADLGVITPEVDSKGNQLKKYRTAEYLYESGVAVRKNPLYVNGVNEASSEDTKGLYQIYFANQFTNGSGSRYQSYSYSSNASGPFNTGEFNTSFQQESSRYVHYYGDYYMLPGDRIVYDFDYYFTYSPAMTAENGKAYREVTVHFTKFDIWVENSANDTAEGYTAYTYDAPVEGGIEGDILMGRMTKNKDTGSYNIGYVYGEDEVLLPQLYIDDKSLGYTQLIEISREDTFTEKYEEELEKDYTEADAAEVVELAKAAQDLTASEKALNADAVAKVEKAITDAGLRPTSKGSTLSVGANTSIGFRAVKPAVSNYDKFGIIVTTFNRMNTKGDKELTLADADVKNYAKAYAMDYTEGANRSEELTFNVYGLFDADVAENVDPWGIWLVARYYTVYKAADGTEVTIYSTNDFGNTPTGKDADETATLNAIAANGQLIRSINGIIRSMADTLYAAKATYANEVGADYVDGYGNPMNNYTGITLAAAYGDDTDGLLSTAAETLYFMKAFKGVFTKILAQNS
ncbi:MAG: hypothetical protein IJP22_02300 [Clostridia bacterium]|nr:hypothetical protein [Clostridia bacterium]